MTSILDVFIQAIELFGIFGYDIENLRLLQKGGTLDEIRFDW